MVEIYVIFVFYDNVITFMISPEVRVVLMRHDMIGDINNKNSSTKDYNP